MKGGESKGAASGGDDAAVDVLGGAMAAFGLDGAVPSISQEDSTGGGLLVKLRRLQELEKVFRYY